MLILQHQGAVTPMLTVGPFTTAVKMRSRGQAPFLPSVKRSRPDFPGRVNGQRRDQHINYTYIWYITFFLLKPFRSSSVTLTLYRVRLRVYLNFSAIKRQWYLYACANLRVGAATRWPAR